MIDDKDSQNQERSKVLGVLKLVQKDTINVFGRKFSYNSSVWVKKPEIRKSKVQLIKLGNKIIIVNVDKNQMDKYKQKRIPSKRKGPVLIAVAPIYNGHSKVLNKHYE